MNIDIVMWIVYFYLIVYKLNSDFYATKTYFLTKSILIYINGFKLKHFVTKYNWTYYANNMRIYLT